MESDTDALDACQRRIGYQFRNRELLRSAMIHASSADHRKDSNVTGETRVPGLAINSLGQVFGSSVNFLFGTSSLLRIDSDTGFAVSIATFFDAGTPVEFVDALAFGPTDILYAILNPKIGDNAR